MAESGDIGHYVEIDCSEAVYYGDLVQYLETGFQTGHVATKPWLRYILEITDAGSHRVEFQDRVVCGDFIGYFDACGRVARVCRVFGVKHFVHHIRVLLCSGDKAAAHHVIKFYAYILQNPGVQTRIVPIFQGKEGTGKNMVNDTIASIFGPVAAEPNADISALCGWNSALVGKLFVVFNEVHSLSAAEQGKLRSAVTESTITRRQKYVNDQAMSNSMNIVILSNQETGLINKTGSDARRWLYLLTSSVPDYDNVLYFKAFAAFLGRDGRPWTKIGVTPGILAVAKYLYNLNIEDYMPSALPKETIGRSHALLTQMDSLQDWFYALLREKRPPLPVRTSPETKTIMDRLEIAFETWDAGQVSARTSELHHAFVAYTGAHMQQHVFVTWLTKTANCCTESRPRAGPGEPRPMTLTFYSQAQCAENFNALIGNVLSLDFLAGAKKSILDQLSISAPDPLKDVLERAKSAQVPAPTFFNSVCSSPASSPPRSPLPQTAAPAACTCTTAACTCGHAAAALNEAICLPTPPQQPPQSPPRSPSPPPENRAPAPAPPTTPRPPPLLSDDEDRPGIYDDEEADSQELAQHAAATEAREPAQGLVAMFRPDRRRGEIAASAEEENRDGPATLEQLMRAASKVDAEVRACEERRRISRLQSAPVPGESELCGSDDEEEDEENDAGNPFVDDGRPASKKQKK